MYSYISRPGRPFISSALLCRSVFHWTSSLRHGEHGADGHGLSSPAAACQLSLRAVETAAAVWAASLRDALAIGLGSLVGVAVLLPNIFVVTDDPLQLAYIAVSTTLPSYVTGDFLGSLLCSLLAGPMPWILRPLGAVHSAAWAFLLFVPSLFSVLMA
jgi:hypothetical protein